MNCLTVKNDGFVLVLSASLFNFSSISSSERKDPSALPDLYKEPLIKKQSTEKEPTPGTYVAAAEAHLLQKADEEAKEALVANNYILCTDSQCVELTGDRRGLPKLEHNGGSWSMEWYHPVPAEHFLTDGALISLHSNRDILPWLPDYSAGPPAANDTHLTMTDSNQLPPRNEQGCLGPSGPWVGLQSIQILKQNSFVESVLYLEMRDDNAGGSPDKGPDLNYLRRVMKTAMTEFNGMRPDRPEYKRTLSWRFQLVWNYYHWRIPGLVSRYIGFRWPRQQLIDEGALVPTFPLRYDITKEFEYYELMTRVRRASEAAKIWAC
ncbi:hypothetical protein BDW69DRAFT_186305 [Aspergillus filifer]